MDAASQPADALVILKQAGLNTARFRVWVNPAAPAYCDIASVAAMALRAHAANLSILIDFHYADNWADPQ